MDTPTPLHGSTLTIVGTHCHDSVDWLLDVLDEDDSTRASIYDCRLRELEKRVARHKRVEVIDKSGERVKLGAFWTYFHWIVTHYDNLPDWIVFMHGHDTSFEHRQMGAAQVVRNCKRLLVRPAGNRELSYSSRCATSSSMWATRSGTRGSTRSATSSCRATRRAPATSQ